MRFLLSLSILAGVLFVSTADAAPPVFVELAMRNHDVTAVVVVYDGPTCDTCRAKWPAWQALKKKWAARGLRIVVVAHDNACKSPDLAWFDDTICDRNKTLTPERLPAADVYAADGTSIQVADADPTAAGKALDEWFDTLSRYQHFADLIRKSSRLRTQAEAKWPSVRAKVRSTRLGLDARLTIVEKFLADYPVHHAFRKEAAALKSQLAAKRRKRD